MSTVSGGGYIGGWLSAWNHRTDCFEKLNQELSKGRTEDGSEPKPIAWLRANQAFLTPTVGPFSPDTWTAIATIMRNIFLNWLVIVPALFALALVPKFLSSWLSVTTQLYDAQSSLYHFLYEPIIGKEPGVADWNGHWYNYLDSTAAGLVVIFLFVATFFRPSEEKRFTDKSFLLWLICTLGAAAVLLTFAVASWTSKEVDWAHELLRGAFLGALVFGIGRSAAAPWVWLKEHTWFKREIVVWLGAGAVVGAIEGVGKHLAVAYYQNWHPGSMSALLNLDYHGLVDPAPGRIATLLAIAGVPWLLVSFFIGDCLFAGFTSKGKTYAGKRSRRSEETREWLARCDGWILLLAVSWFSVAIVSFEGWNWLQHLGGWLYGIFVTAGAAALIGGTGSLSAALRSRVHRERVPVTAITTFSAGAFLVTGFAFISILSDPIPKYLAKFLSVFAARSAHIRLPGMDVPVFRIGIAIIILFLISLFASKFININWFSLHALYRNRLVKTFLGASRKNPDTDRNQFTGFAASDNLGMADLRGRQTAIRNSDGDTPGIRQPLLPFHVLNVTLNVSKSKNLAWQERKAEPFICTPLHVGGNYVGYRDAAVYASGVPVRSRSAETEGITLGTAMAISGAAISPNWGYHTSVLTSFVMMLLNVRLGWWLGNPKQGKWWKQGPTYSASLFPREAIAQTDDQSNWIYLSDGGHFENLGVYEMVRRQCRLIIVCDAGADRRFAYADLGNAIRKIYVDLGIRVKIDHLFMQPRRRPFSTGVYCAHGWIQYNDGPPGQILYIKPGIYEDDLPADLKSYAAGNPEFPHDTTTNQWFGESQFQAYRSLGTHAIATIARSRHGQRKACSQPGPKPDPSDQVSTSSCFFQRAQDYIEEHAKSAKEQPRQLVIDLMENV